MTILVLSPHPDDETLGCGGTIAKYSAAKERVIVVVFSSGEQSHPLHKEHLITKTRKAEAEEAHKILGVTESVFLMLQDTNLRDEIVQKEVIPQLGKLIKKEKPSKIFIPAIDDLLPDHRAVAHALLQVYTQYELDCDVYTYSIWNPLSIIKRSQPRLVVNTTEYQKQKIEAIKTYKSQWVAMYQVAPIALLKNFFSGMRYGHRWCEVFIQVK